MEKKITQKEYYNALISYLKGEETSFTADDLIPFVESRLALLNNRSANRKPSKAKVETDSFREVVLQVLANATEPMTASEVLADDAIADDVTLPKVTSALTFLKNAGKVERIEDGKKVKFKIAETAPAEDDVE